MKNTIKIKAICKIAGIIALLAVIGFSMLACDNGTTGSPLQGTWKNEFDDSDGHNVLTYKFTGSNFSCTYTWPGVNGTYSGTFSFTDTTITFNMTAPSSDTWTQNYTITGKTLYLQRDAQGHFNGSYIKQ